MQVLPILQARMASSRLPGKILKPFSSGRNTIDYVVQTLRHAGFSKVVLATTDTSEDDPLAEKYDESELIVYRGDENNVLSRYTEVIERHNPDYIVRICADNPLLHGEGIRFLVDQIAKSPETDYLSFSCWGRPAMLCSLGIFAEVIKATALTSIQDPSNLEREHVTIGLYGPEASGYKLFDFEQHFFAVDPRIRLTMDTPVDFENIDSLISRFPEFEATTSNLLQEMFQYIEQSDLIEKMRRENSRPVNSKNYKENQQP